MLSVCHCCSNGDHSSVSLSNIPGNAILPEEFFLHVEHVDELLPGIVKQRWWATPVHRGHSHWYNSGLLLGEEKDGVITHLLSLNLFCSASASSHLFLTTYTIQQLFLLVYLLINVISEHTFML